MDVGVVGMVFVFCVGFSEFVVEMVEVYGFVLFCDVLFMVIVDGIGMMFCYDGELILSV